MYRKKWDSVKQVFLKTPLHDYSSDAADAFRYAAIMANKKFKAAPTPHESIANALVSGREVTLDGLFTQREQSMNKHSFKSKRV